LFYDAQLYCGIYFSSMALISNAVTHGSITEEQLDEAFSADRKSVDILSTDFDSST
jgi:hypothetical protein